MVSASFIFSVWDLRWVVLASIVFCLYKFVHEKCDAFLPIQLHICAYIEIYMYNVYIYDRRNFFLAPPL